MEEVLDDLIEKFWKNERTLEMQQLAGEHGWKFIPRGRFAEQPTALKGFGLFKGKRGKRITGLLEPAVSGLGYRSRVYDYIYYGDGGKKKTTVIELQNDQLDLYPFRIHPKRGLSRLFSRRESNYVLEADDVYQAGIQIPESAWQLIDQHDKLTLEGEGSTLLYYYYKRLIPASSIPDEQSMAVEIAEKILLDRENEYV